MYTGDAAASLAALREDTLSSYRAVCRALGEQERTDIVSGALPAAAALGINLPNPALHSTPLALPPAGGAAVGSIMRLPPISSGRGSALALPPSGGLGGKGLGLGLGLGLQSPAEAATAALGPGGAYGGGTLLGSGLSGRGGGGGLLDGVGSYGGAHGGGVAMGLGQEVGIEAVGSGAAAPGVYRSLSAGSSPYGLQAGSGHSGAAGGLADGPRVGMLSGLGKPQVSG